MIDNHDTNNINIISSNLCPSSFDDKVNEATKNALNVSHVNIRSLPKNVDGLRLLYEYSLQTKFHVIGLSEVWNVSLPHMLGLRGYALEVKCREAHQRGGGVGAYIHSSVPYKVLSPSLEVNHAESLWIEASFEKQTFLIGIIYRKPNTDVLEFQESLLGTLENLKVDKMKCVLMGDFNINAINPGSREDDFITALQCMQFQQLIEVPTRVHNISRSLIDHVYANFSSKCVNSGTIDTDISDHFPIYAIFEDELKKQSYKQKIFKRNYRYYNKVSFCEELSAQDWSNIENGTNVNDAYDTFLQTFGTICDKHAPILKCFVKQKGARNPWITKAILKSIRRKHKLYSKMISSNHQPQHVEKYKKYRNVLTNVLRKAKRDYYSTLFMTHKNDTGQTWKVINDLLYSGNSKSKVTQVEKLCLDSNGRRTQVSSAEEIGQVFNDFFVNVGPNLASNIQKATNGNSFRDYLCDQGKGTLNFKPITEYEVQCQLLSLNVNKACGHDTIPARLIGDAADFIARPLSHIFNLSLLTGKVPNSLKVAKVTPIYKKKVIRKTLVIIGQYLSFHYLQKF